MSAILKNKLITNVWSNLMSYYKYAMNSYTHVNARNRSGYSVLKRRKDIKAK